MSELIEASSSETLTLFRAWADFPAQALLDALDGVAYVVDAAGVILSVGERHWTEFAAANGGKSLQADQVVGRSLLDTITGEPVRAAYREIHQQVLSGRRRYVSFRYRCDAPDRQRKLRMSITALEGGEAGTALLYHSVLLSDVERPWMSLFGPEAAIAYMRQDQSRPLVHVCCVCHDVALDTGAARHWVAPERYYALGGETQVRVSHGLCDPCADRMLQDETSD